MRTRQRKILAAGRRRTLAIAATLAAVAALLSACDFTAPEELVSREPAGAAARGKTLLHAYGCSACHRVPDVSGRPAHIGPPLTDWSERKYIAGRLPNQPDMLIRWIMDPQAVEPGTAMPDLGVTETEARDIAAYLYSH